MTFITSLFSVSSVATWIFLPLNAIFLTLDGIIFSLVAYSYKLFLLMAQMNFNVIYAWVGPLIDRVKALILVLILFKLGYSLIQYMLNPDKIEDRNIGGAALIKNIAISAALLVCYSFVFSFLNEISLLIVGVPEGYTFTTLNDLAGVTYDDADKNGLIARFIFGEDSETTDDFGKFLSVATLQIFLHGKDGVTSQAEQLYDSMLAASADDSDFNMMEIVTFVSEIDRSIEYTYPILSGAIGCYLIYSIVKIAIEIGVRMFKLVVLQILAPVAIIAIIDGGFDNKIWKNYIDTFSKTYVDIFIRVGSMFLVTAFISKFWAEKTELFPEVDSFTRFLVMIIVIVAAYRFATLLPKFIDSVFGSRLSENNAKGFGKFMSGLAGGAIGLGTGLVAGATSGAGFFGTLGNTLAGGYNGATNGYKGNSVADFFKNTSATTKANQKRALDIARQGGGLRYVGAKAEGALGIPDRQNERAQIHADNNKLIDNVLNAQAQEIAGLDSSVAGLKYGSDRDAFASSYASNDAGFIAAQKAYNDAVESGTATDSDLTRLRGVMERARSDAKRDGKDEWNRAADSANGADVRTARAELHAAQRGSSQVDWRAGRSSLEAQKETNKNAYDAIQRSGATRRANRQGTFGGK